MTEIPNIEKKKFNAYDSNDIVHRVALMKASSDVSAIKMAAYRIYDPETQTHSNLQFHFTSGDTIMAVLSENAAKLFAGFIQRTIDGSGEANG